MFAFAIAALAIGICLRYAFLFRSHQECNRLRNIGTLSSGLRFSDELTDVVHDRVQFHCYWLVGIRESRK